MKINLEFKLEYMWVGVGWSEKKGVMHLWKRAVVFILSFLLPRN